MITDRDETTSPVARTQRTRLGTSARTIQIVLGCLWIFDACLQFQPAMFGRQLVTQMILPAAHGQPAPAAWSILTLGRFVLPDVGMWNFLFASLQLAIGVGLLFRRTVRPALLASFAWALGVWWFGEGFGMLLTGKASPLTGAPGAVLLYAAIGLLVWPKRDDQGDPAHYGRVGVASSAAGSGPLGASAALVVWAAFWVGSAILWLLPSNRAHGAIHDAISSAASGQPLWYAHWLESVARSFGNAGSDVAWICAIASLVIGLGPMFVRRPEGFLAAGIVLELAFWVTGMGLGGVFTGMGTDPQTGPLVALLGVSMLPTAVSLDLSQPSLGRSWISRHAVGAGALAAGAFGAVLLSATYPLSSSIGGSLASASTSSSSSAGSSSSMPGMSMPGMSGTTSSNSSKAGGSGDPSWKYTGPPLPAQEVSLLTTVFTDTEKGHAMQTPDCTKAPTQSQVTAALTLTQQTSAAVAKYKDLSAAVADGYIPITDPSYPVVHYIKISYMRGKYVLDPDHVQSLVYAFTPQGPVLAAAMYLMPSGGQPGPMPGGCLTQWHAHTNLCVSAKTGQISGFAPCGSGMMHLSTPEMMHVWQVPVPGGSLAMDPTDQQVVEAAIMAQEDGQAPVTQGYVPQSLPATSFGL